MNRNIFLSLIMIALCVPAATAVAADYKIGVVNVRTVLEAAPQTEAALKKLKKEFATRDRDLTAAQKALKDLEDRLTKDGAIMSESERSRLEREIISKRRDIQRDTQEFQEDFNFRRTEETGKIQERIAEAIVELAKKEGYDLMLGAGVIYAGEKVDVTQQVIDILKKGN